MEPVRIDSFCQFHFVSNPGFSPDGRYIAFVVRQADLKSNSYPGNLYFMIQKRIPTVSLPRLGR